MRQLFVAVCAALLWLPSEVKAQMDSLLFCQESSIDRQGKGELRVRFDNVSFVRDNEYQGRLTKGYTLPGLWLQPTLRYQPLKNLTVEAGVYLLRYWGADKYPNLNYHDVALWKGGQTQKGFHCLPVFRVQLALSRQFDLVLGTLYGKNNHQLVEPLYNPEMGLTGDPEAGVQLLWRTRPAHVDLWVNWESFIFRNDDHQEAFTFGLSTRFRANRPEATAHVYFPVQAVFQHRGGEINPTAASRSVKTWLNAAAGVGLDIHLRNRCLTRLNLEAVGTYFGQQSGRVLPFDKGYGLYAKAAADVWRFRVNLGYWQCKDFVSIHGNPLFGTVSVDEEGVTYDTPQMLTARLEYSQRLAKGIAWGIHADAYDHLPTDVDVAGGRRYREGHALSLAAGLYLRVNLDWLVKRF